MINKKAEVFQVSNGDAYCEVEAGSSVMLKAMTGAGDPVELSAEEAVERAHAFLKAAHKVV